MVEYGLGTRCGYEVWVGVLAVLVKMWVLTFYIPHLHSTSVPAGGT